MCRSYISSYVVMIAFVQRTPLDRLTMKKTSNVLLQNQLDNWLVLLQSLPSAPSSTDSISTSSVSSKSRSEAMYAFCKSFVPFDNITEEDIGKFYPYITRFSWL